MNIKEKIDGFLANAKKNIKTIIMDLAVALVSVAYVFYQLLTLEPTKLNPIVLLGQAIIGIIAGTLIKMGLGENGFIKGYAAKDWISAFVIYDAFCDIALPYIDNSEEYKEIQEKEMLEKLRRRRLSKGRMKYDDWFDANGDYIDHEIKKRSWYEKRKKKYPDFQLAKDVRVLDKKQRRILNGCIALKVYPLDLFSEYDANNEEATKREETDRDVKSRNLRRNIIFATGISLIGVYFLPQWKWDWGHFLWALMQVSLWIGLGILQLYNNFTFVTKEKASQLSRKEKGIIKFCKMYMPADKFKIEDFTSLTVVTDIKEIADVKPKKEKNQKPKEPEFIEVEMTEEELKAKGYIK